MQKIILSVLLMVFSISINAQNAISRETIQSSPNKLVEFASEDIDLISEEHKNLTANQKKALYDLNLYKYQVLSNETSENELIALTNSLKERTKFILGNDLFMEISQNENLFHRITGLIYLVQN